MFCKITGNTYDIKDGLKVCGCKWLEKERAWQTPFLKEGDPLLRKIKEICKHSHVNISHHNISEECQTIQNILNKKK